MTTTRILNRLRRAAAVPERGIGALVLTLVLLAPAGTALALTDDDPAPPPSEVVVVRIPDHSGTLPTDSPAPSPTSAPAAHHGGAAGELPGTGVDWWSWWPGALLALGMTVAGSVLISVRHRRARQRVRSSR